MIEKGKKPRTDEYTNHPLFVVVGSEKGSGEAHQNPRFEPTGIPRS